MAMLKPVRVQEINKETVPDRQPEKYRGVEVETTYTEQRPLALYIEGQQWFVDYYKQILNDDDEGNPLSTDTPFALQQYRKIKNTELKLTSPLSGSFDSAPNEWTMTGTANMYPSIVPNKGDVFVADIGDGRSGIFVVEVVNEKSIYKDTAYEIDFSLMFEYREDGHGENLERKVVETLYFEKDRILYGDIPLVTEKKHLSDIELRQWEKLLFEKLFSDFVDSDEMTWRVPVAGYRLYDFHYTQMMMKLFETDSILLRSIRLLNLGIPRAQQSYSFWDVLLDKDRKRLALVDKQFHITTRGAIYAPAVLNSAFYSTFNAYNVPMSFVKYAVNGKMEVEHVTKDLAFVVDIQSRKVDLDKQPTIYHVSQDNAYVLSDFFYNDQGNLSVLEDLVKNYLDNKGVNQERLQQLLDECLLWCPLDQFYYFPILIILIRECIYGG